MPKRPRRLLILVSLVVGALAASGVALERGLSAEPSGCASCHIMRRYVEGSRSGRDLDAAHARARIACTKCHSGYTFSARARSAALYAAGARGAPSPRRYGDAMCNECHVGIAHLAVKTDFLVRNPHRSHWPELACADCHPAHARQVDFCGQCHENGGQRMTGDPVVPRAPNPFWLEGQCRANGPRAITGP